MLLDFIEPDRNTQETLTICEVKDNDYTIGTLVVGICNRAVALLPSRIPYLKLYRALIDLQSSEAEIDSNRTNVVFLKAIILNAVQYCYSTIEMVLTANLIKRHDLPT